MRINLRQVVSPGIHHCKAILPTLNQNPDKQHSRGHTCTLLLVQLVCSGLEVRADLTELILQLSSLLLSCHAGLHLLQRRQKDPWLLAELLVLGKSDWVKRYCVTCKQECRTDHLRTDTHELKCLSTTRCDHKSTPSAAACEKSMIPLNYNSHESYIVRLNDTTARLPHPPSGAPHPPI